MIEGLQGLCSASTPSLVKSTVQHDVSILLGSTRYYYCVHGLPRRAVWAVATQQRFDATISNKPCLKDSVKQTFSTN